MLFKTAVERSEFSRQQITKGEKLFMKLLTKDDLKMGQAVILIWYSTRTFEWTGRVCLIERGDSDSLVLYEPNESVYRFFETKLYLIYRDFDGEVVIKNYKPNAF